MMISFHVGNSLKYALMPATVRASSFVKVLIIIQFVLNWTFITAKYFDKIILIIPWLAGIAAS